MSQTTEIKLVDPLLHRKFMNQVTQEDLATMSGKQKRIITTVRTLDLLLTGTTLKETMA